jgi:ornithine cyclodeaminase
VKAPAILELAQIQDLITPALALEAVRSSLLSLAAGKAVLPPAIGVETPQGEFHLKGAYLESSDYVGFKVASGFPDNPSIGLSANSGFSVALDAHTGELVALLLDGGWLTEIRTAAAGALAAQLLSRTNSSVVALIGAGVQAGYQLEALKAVRRVSEVRVWSRTARHAESFAAERIDSGVSVAAVGSVRQAVDGADIVITATPSRTPLVRAEWLSPGVHITAMGSDSPGKQELDVEVLARADVIVADQIANSVESGELQHAVAARRVDVADVVEFSDLVAGHALGRTREEQRTIADQSGLGIYDAAMVDLVMRATGRRDG